MRSLLVGFTLLLGVSGCATAPAGPPMAAQSRPTTLQLLPAAPLPLAAVAPAGLLPVTLGAQWAWRPGGVIAPTCLAPNVGGLSCVRVPQGARIWALAWQSSVKVLRHEVLLHLVASPVPEVLGAGLLSTLHVSLTSTTHVERHLALPAPLVVPAGWYLWVYVDGGGDPHPSPVEVQTTLYLEPTAVTLP